ADRSLHVGGGGDRPAGGGASRRPRRSRGAAAPSIRRYHARPRVPGRGGKAEPGNRSAHRRGGSGHRNPRPQHRETGPRSNQGDHGIALSSDERAPGRRRDLPKNFDGWQLPRLLARAASAQAATPLSTLRKLRHLDAAKSINDLAETRSQLLIGGLSYGRGESIRSLPLPSEYSMGATACPRT